MADPYLSTVAPDGATIDQILSYVSRLEQNDEQPVGFIQDLTSSYPTVQRIDINGNNFNPASNFFDNWSITGSMKRVVRNRSTGAITPGKNGKGDRLDLTGASGDILVQIPTAHYALSYSEGDTLGKILIPFSTEDIRYPVHPCAPQRGGVARNRIYVGAYEASLVDNNGTLQFGSVSGVQPWTGSAMRSLSFTTGKVAFTIGETLTNATTGSTGVVVAYHITSGSWAGGDAAGVVYIRQSTGTSGAGTLNGSISGNACAAASAESSPLTLTIAQAEAYANAIGAGFGITNVHTWSYIHDLMVLEYGTLNLQSSSGLGRGIVDLADNTVFAGLLTGADSIDSRLLPNGTGVGAGTDGQTPISYRGIENPYGNLFKYLIGINLYTDGTYRVVKRDGLAATAIPATLTDAATYETGNGIPTAVDGYIKTINSDDLGMLLYMPKAATASNTTYFCDEYLFPRAGPSIVRAGGKWSSSHYAGPGMLDASISSTATGVMIGARIEYIPQS